MNYALAYKPTWVDRLRWKLFPIDTCDIPDIPARDYVIVRASYRLSLLGRLRALVSGRIEVETKTATENIVGACESSSCLNIRAPRFMDRERWLSRGAGDPLKFRPQPLPAGPTCEAKPASSGRKLTHPRNGRQEIQQINS